MSRRSLAVTVVGIILASAVALLLWSRNEARVASPAPAERETVAAQNLNQPFPYRVGHCGLGHVVELDGSYWDLDRTTLTEIEDQRFGINSDTGTMTLVAPDTAIYRSWRGGEATLHRHKGPKQFDMCA